MEIKNGVLVKWSGLSENLRVPDCISKIGDCAFLRTNVKHVELPESVKYIGVRAFALSALESINFDYVIEIDTEAFSNTHIESAVFGRATTIGKDAFTQCVNLRTVYFSDYLRHMGSGAFYECVNLADLSIPDGVESIESSAFFCCYNLSKVTIPERFINDSIFGFLVASASQTGQWFETFRKKMQAEDDEKTQELRKRNGVCRYCGATFHWVGFWEIGWHAQDVVKRKIIRITALSKVCYLSGKLNLSP